MGAVDAPPSRRLRSHELAELDALAARSDTAIAARARLVLASDGGLALSARQRRRADQWRSRYLRDGAVGLRDRPRSGRPRLPVSEASPVAEAPQALTKREVSYSQVVCAPLFMPVPDWSSRAIAQALGTSQSHVARVWRQAYPDTDLFGAGLPPGGLRLVACAVAPGNSLLLLAGAAGPGGSRPEPRPMAARQLMRAAHRRPVQTLLAAGAHLEPGVDAAPGRGVLGGGAGADLVQHVRRGLDPQQQLYVLSRTEQGYPVMPGVSCVVVADAAAWQAMLRPLVVRCSASAPEPMAALQHALMEWARGGGDRFEWREQTYTSTSMARPTALPVTGDVVPRATAEVVADQAFSLLLDWITAGRLAPGDRVTEAALARALRTSRGHTRDALRVLASRNLLELEPHRGAIVPTARVAHIVETYSARRVLGTLLVRRAVHCPPEDLVPVSRALARMVEIARSNDSHATGNADLELQDVLAQATRMARIAPMFHTLTAQLRLYIALLGLNYLYPIADMCQDDVALVAAIRRRAEGEAVKIWNAKIDKAVAVMTAQLAVRRP